MPDPDQTMTETTTKLDAGDVRESLLKGTTKLEALDLPADGSTVEAQLDGGDIHPGNQIDEDAGPTLSSPEVLDRLDRAYRRSVLRLGRKVLYRPVVALHRPPITEVGWIVKVHAAENPGDVPRVDLQVLYSEGVNGSRLVVNVEYDPDDEKAGTWSLPD